MKKSAPGHVKPEKENPFGKLEKVHIGGTGGSVAGVPSGGGALPGKAGSAPSIPPGGSTTGSGLKKG